MPDKEKARKGEPFGPFLMAEVTYLFAYETAGFDTV
jgi:hypothetical protein